MYLSRFRSQFPLVVLISFLQVKHNKEEELSTLAALLLTDNDIINNKEFQHSL